MDRRRRRQQSQAADQGRRFRKLSDLLARRAQIAYVSWDDDKAGRIKVVGVGGGEGRIVTPEPGHYVEPAFSPDGSLIAYRKTTRRLPHHPALRPRPRHLCRPGQGRHAEARRQEAARQPMFGATSDRIFFTATGEEEKAAAEVGVRSTGTEEVTHLISQNAARIRPVARRAVHRLDRALPGLCHALRPLRPLDRHRARRQGAAAVARSAPTPATGSTGRATAARSTGARGPTFTASNLGTSGAFAGGKLAAAPLVAELGFTASQASRRGSIALTGARIVTMRGDEVIENGTILIDGDRIAAVGPTAAISYPAGTRTIDVSGKTIIPGLIDAHWHGSMGSELIIPKQNWFHAAALAYGVTTVHDPSNDTFEIFAASEYQKAGKILGPRIFSTGTILYGATTPFTVEINSLDDALSHLRRLQGVGRLVGQELQPAAPRAAADDHRGGAPARHGGGARRRLAVRDEHDDDRRRPHDDRAFAARSPKSTTTCCSSGAGRAPPTRRPWSSPTAARSARITGTSTPRSGRSRSCRAGCRGRCSTPARAGR